MSGYTYAVGLGLGPQETSRFPEIETFKGVKPDCVGYKSVQLLGQQKVPERLASLRCRALELRDFVGVRGTETLQEQTNRCFSTYQRVFFIIQKLNDPKCQAEAQREKAEIPALQRELNQAKSENEMSRLKTRIKWREMNAGWLIDNTPEVVVQLQKEMEEAEKLLAGVQVSLEHDPVQKLDELQVHFRKAVNMPMGFEKEIHLNVNFSKVQKLLAHFSLVCLSRLENEKLAEYDNHKRSTVMAVAFFKQEFAKPENRNNKSLQLLAEHKVPERLIRLLDCYDGHDYIGAAGIIGLKEYFHRVLRRDPESVWTPFQIPLYIAYAKFTMILAEGNTPKAEKLTRELLKDMKEAEKALAHNLKLLNTLIAKKFKNDSLPQLTEENLMRYWGTEFASFIAGCNYNASPEEEFQFVQEYFSAAAPKAELPPKTPSPVPQAAASRKKEDSSSDDERLERKSTKPPESRPASRSSRPATRPSSRASAATPSNLTAAQKFEALKEQRTKKS